MVAHSTLKQKRKECKTSKHKAKPDQDRTTTFHIVLLLVVQFITDVILASITHRI